MKHLIGRESTATEMNPRNTAAALRGSLLIMVGVAVFIMCPREQVGTQIRFSTSRPELFSGCQRLYSDIERTENRLSVHDRTMSG